MTSAPYNYGGLDEHFSDYKTSRFVVVPVPYDKTTTYIKGTAGGPDAIIDASRNMELYDEELDCNVAESGIATLDALTVEDLPPEEMVSAVEAACFKVASDGKIPVVLGGEHSLSYGVLLALKKAHGEVSVLQFDAHADLRDEYEGSKFSHACVMKRIREEADAVQVGIRSLCDDEAEEVKELRAQKKLFFASDILEKDCRADILEGLKEKVFITFDVDGIDPSLIPATGTPEPGGLGWYDVLRIIRAVSREKKIVGFDLVELCPSEHSKPSDFTVAKLAYKMMSYTGKSFLFNENE